MWPFCEETINIIQPISFKIKSYSMYGGKKAKDSSIKYFKIVEFEEYIQDSTIWVATDLFQNK